MNEIVSDLGEAAAKSIPAVAVLTFNLQDGLAVLAIIWTAFATLAAVVYNLVADVVGGIELVVLEETLLPPAEAQVPAPAASAWSPVQAGATSTNGGSTSVDVPTEETPVAVT